MFCTNIAFIRNTYNLSHCSKLVLHHILPQISSHCIAPLESSVMSKSWKSRSPFSGRGLFSRKCGDLHAQQDQPNLHQHTLIFMCTQMPTNHPAAFSRVETHRIQRSHSHIEMEIKKQIQRKVWRSPSACLLFKGKTDSKPCVCKYRVDMLCANRADCTEIITFQIS